METLNIVELIQFYEEHKHDNEVSRELETVPFDKMLESMAKGIAKAQNALDMNSMAIALRFSGANEKDKVPFGNSDKKLSMMELGFKPTFYQFVDTIIEIKVVVKMTRGNTSTNSSMKAEGDLDIFSTSASVSTVSSSYTQKYSFSSEASSSIRTKLVPIPPPAVLETRIQRLLNEDSTSS